MKVFSAPASDAGEVGAWTPEAALPEAVYYHAGATVNGNLFVLGGFHYTDANGMAVSNVVYRAKIGAGGGVGAWQTATPLPQPVFFPSAASWNGRIYVTGGWNGSTLVNTVYSAEVLGDGSLGPWVAQKSLPEAVYTHAAVSNGTLYVLGGTVNGGNDIQNSVYFAKINADGTLADWAATTPLPSPVSNHGAVVANGRVIVLGGWTGAAPTEAVQSSPVESAGGLGAWSGETPLPNPLYLLATAASPSHIFVSGGIDYVAIRSAVYSLPLPAPLAPAPPPVAADTLPPRTTIAFGSPFYGGAPFISPNTPATLAAVDDARVVGDGAGVGVASTQWAVDDGTFSAYAAPIRVAADGSHWIRFRSVDALGHAEDVRASSAAVDGTAPASVLTIGSPKAVLASGETIVGPDTLLAVSAEDPVVNGAASGVAATLASVDGGPLAPSAAPFLLPAVDGAHAVVAKALDNVGNEEAAHSATVFRDGTAPVTTLAFSAAPYASPSGAIYGAGLALSFTAVDPVSGGIAAGVNHTEYAFDGGSTAAYAGPFGAAEGARTLSYRSVDGVGNAEAARGVSFLVDATPPMSALSVSGGTTLFGEDLAGAGSAVSLTAEDPISGGVASGVGRIVYSVDGGADRTYTAPFVLGAGRHAVSFGAIDRAGNAEDRRTVAVSPGAFLTDALTATGKIELSDKAGVVGVVRTNSAFTADGKSFVDGDVAGLTVTLEGRSTVSGAVTRGQATMVPPAYDLDAARTWAKAHNDNAALPARLLSGGALILDGRASATLPAGDYYLTGLQLRGKSSLAVSGRVNIFLDGPLTMRGGSSLNGSGDASSLWIVSADQAGRAYEKSGDDDERDEEDDGEDRRGHDESVFLNGKSRAAFNLYAPLSSVRALGKGQLAGRLLAKAVSMSGTILQPSTTALPPSKHERKSSETRPPLAARDGNGTAGGGHAGGRDESVASSTLERREPHKEWSRPVLPPQAALSSKVPEIRAAREMRVKSSMPALALSARAAFASVGRDASVVRSKDRTAVVIPEGAATAGLGVTVSPPKKSDVLENRRQADVQERKGLVAAASGVQYGPEGTHFAKPVTLELPYDRASLPAGVAENDLRVHYWNPVVGDWEKLESSVDTQNQIVRAQTTHFSLYQIFGGGSAASAPATVNDPTFAIHAAYAFPSPSRGGAPVVIRVQPGLADSVTVRVYDLSGRMVHESSNFQNRIGYDDGNGFGQQYTFDHTWDVSGVGSGVYKFVVTGHKAGAGNISESGKVGVIK
ncbi:MAG: hypothetical protein PHS14_05530 [Elusimicrobia bacterium]|nr:hypothetical protein [Elusimicrobiota bacterium]